MAQGRMIGLDGVRGVAAIAVMLFHAHMSFAPVLHGYLAVDLFFMLSGFVIAKSYEPVLAGADSRPAMGVGRYMLVRLERLYPMLLLGGLIGFGVFSAGLAEFVPLGRADLVLAIVSQFLLIPFLSSDGFYAFNRAQWSIALELLANFVHALLLPFLGIRVLAVILAVSALGLAVAAMQCGTLNTVCRPPAEAFYPVLLLSRATFGFFMGVLLFRTQDRWRPAMPNISFALLASVVLVALSMPGDWTSEGPGRAIYDFVCVVAILPLILMLGVEVRAGAVATELGRLSYPLYAIHLPLLDALRNSGGTEAQAALLIPVLMLVAWALGRWFDEPLNAWRRRLRSTGGEAAGAPKVASCA